ncbi:dihydroorotate oxidase, partial [Candidatus Micrarchaeota archaeon]|nr:dihydroorotate oxidase [Candidatus Micrarchaeota archaeon]
MKELFGLKFSSLAMNASGPRCTSFEDLRRIAFSGSCAIVTKSTTLLPRVGNPEPRYKTDAFGAIQSMGLPNPGVFEMAERVRRLRLLTEKPIIASVAGFTPEEYAWMSLLFDESGADMIEVNLSCPNVAGKPQAAYDAEQTREIISSVKEKTKLPTSVKLPCYPDAVVQEKIADVLLDVRVDCITAINSVGNCVILRDKKPIIRPVFGGLCGDYIKPVALGTVKRFYDLFGGRIKIIGVGGIKTRADVDDFISVGADLVQIGTAYEEKGVSVFGDLKKGPSAQYIRG